MRNWKNWLFPLLTCLTVAALTLLPLRLSVLEDEQLTGAIHAEPLSEDSNFPFKPPELPGRLWLMLQWREMPDNLTIMAQELSGKERDRENQRLQKALLDIQDILPPGMAVQLAEMGSDYSEYERYYLRDQTDLSSASFSRIGNYDKRTELSYAATLDVESGQIVSLEVASIDRTQYKSPPVELGKALLDHLGLDYEVLEGAGERNLYGVATFRLPECKARFYAGCDMCLLYFNFQLDWDAVDDAAADAYGYPHTDADSMQKW